MSTWAARSAKTTVDVVIRLSDMKSRRCTQSREGRHGNRELDLIIYPAIYGIAVSMSTKEELSNRYHPESLETAGCL